MAILFFLTKFRKKENAYEKTFMPFSRTPGVRISEIDGAELVETIRLSSVLGEGTQNGSSMVSNYI